MSYRRERKMWFDKGLLIVVLVIGAMIIPISISQMNDVRPERLIYTEGLITEKNVERGFGSAYIFVLNGTTDISVYRWQYESFMVGDYIRIYIVLFGYEIIKVNV